ncbi:MAG: DUF512 domain-containing protein, partial [Clostridia bacterium]|nr:DUF512 domain-containing protein [Clostridia bacterium]
MAIVTEVEEESIVRGRVRPGDDVLAFSGRKFVDVLDYIYADGCDKGTITLMRDGVQHEVAYKNRGGLRTLGLSFDSSVEIVPRNCANNCLFCFVRQLPKNLRDTLYVKDDDYRLSFISGSYITCTNLKEEDIERILYYKLSPLYISVHATDKAVQKRLLGIKKDFDQLALLRRFHEAGIKFHTQIVLVKGINDGEVLKKSLQDTFDVGAETIAVVPVGLTGHRSGLPDLQPVDKATAESCIDICEEFYRSHPGFCYCSDEMYQIAERETPPAEYYGNFDQIENGVGLIAKFFQDFNEELSYGPKSVRRTVGLFTGVSGESTMRKAKAILESKYKGLHVNIYVVKNHFFGETVTVTGLVTATDIIDQYGKTPTDDKYFLIPSVMLKEFGNQFLDNMTVEELSEKMN